MVTTPQIAPLTPEISSAPTWEDIKALLDWGESHFRPFHQQCKVEEDYYFLRRKTPHPPGTDPVRPATARAIIDVATDHVDVNNMTIDIPLMVRSKARAEKIKKFYIGAWNSIREPVLRTAVKHAFTYGIAWLQPMVNMTLWPDAPDMNDFGITLENGDVMLVREEDYREALKDFMERKRLTFPFMCRNINPKEMMWDDSATGPKWVIRSIKSTRGDISKRFPEWTARTPGKRSDPVVWREYWDERYYAFMVDDEFVRPPTEHGQGGLLFHSVVPASALDFDTGMPHERYQGILFPVHQLLDSEARLVTQMEAILRTIAWRTLDIYGNEHQARQVQDEYELYGSMNVIPTGVEIRPSPLANLPPDLLNHLSLVQTMIEEATFPNVVRGLRPKGLSTGFAVSVLAGMGRLRFQGVADGLSRAVEGCNSSFSRLLVNLVRSSVTVHARSEVHSFDETIAPKDVADYYENTVVFKAEAPEEREREALLARQLYSQKMISLYEAQRRIGIPNPLDEQNQMAAEQLLQELRPEQLQRLKAKLGSNLGEQQAEAAGALPTPEGNRFLPGQGRLPRPGEANIQRQRVATRSGQPSVFPQGPGGLDILGSQLGTPQGGAVGQPNGQTIRRGG